ncbi:MULTISPECIES: class II fumarate hydratase [Vibrio]|uniref:Fumarate hydratase class II n=1 Tax=Vibrio algicola TaxID=2662262 RepID=A0A5Q0THR9_9VIBR|nr:MULTISPECIES: class II fumarate hydratase [Vibrio]MBD1577132.1 class II fumarate hydratase [Vibrio sp. S11_S32]
MATNHYSNQESSVNKINSNHDQDTSDYRIEHDSMGEVQVPTSALYQAQTQRAINNFPISGLTLPIRFIQSITMIKQAASVVNLELGLLDHQRAQAIEVACSQIIEGEYNDQFPIDVFQTGSGTSTNMNVNEVVATLSNRTLANQFPHEGSQIEQVHPNDHVNMSQSSNDVIPTAIQLSCLTAIHTQLLPAMSHLISVLETKALQNDDIVKTGRTHLMDAMPVTLGQELRAWKTQVQRAQQRIEDSLPELQSLAQGGTAVGTGINAPETFAAKIAQQLSDMTGISLHASDNPFYNLSCQDSSVALSGELKSYAVALMKIANDLRWMNSGPLAGIGEIELAALQPGSSIMPGKVNPVIPEAVAMAAAQVIGNDTTITAAGQSGNFQLNVMLPLIAYNLLQSVELLSNCSVLLADKTIKDFSVRQDNLDKALAKNPILVTALNPIIGYEQAAKIAKKSYQQQRSILDVAEQETSLSRVELEALLDPIKLTQGGVGKSF